jgi:hypothetical protein
MVAHFNVFGRSIGAHYVGLPPYPGAPWAGWAGKIFMSSGDEGWAAEEEERERMLDGQMLILTIL